MTPWNLCLAAWNTEAAGDDSWVCPLLRSTSDEGGSYSDRRSRIAAVSWI